jgi:small subunit ribosomal protein S20
LSFGRQIGYSVICTRMANTFSALKRMRQTKRKTVVNRLRKSRLRHQIRSMRRLIASKDSKSATDALPATFSLIDRSARWGIIKKNTAARYKSRLQARLKAIA